MKRVRYYLAVAAMVLPAVGCQAANLTERQVVGTAPIHISENEDGSEAPVETLEQEGDEETAVPNPQRETPTIPPENFPEQTTATQAAAPEAAVDLNSSDLPAPIYAAAVRRVYNVDFPFGDGPEFPLVYIVSTTDDGAGLDVPLTPPQTLSPALQQGLTEALADQPFEIIWVPSVDDVPVDAQGQIADGQGIYILLGNILPQADGSVHVPFFMVCGPLCLTGKSYVLSEVEGTWEVTGDTGLVIQG